MFKYYVLKSNSGYYLVSKFLYSLNVNFKRDEIVDAGTKRQLRKYWKIYGLSIQ